MPLYDNHSDLSPQTNMRLEFGNKIKRRRNVEKCQGLLRLNTNPIHFQPGEKLSETASDPLHRKPEYIMLQQRLESPASGRSRGYYRPAAPQLVAWKYGYWRQQPGHIGARIGPYNANKEQSIWGRIAGFMSGGSNG